jgi:penicillin-binding protein 2
MRNQLHIDWRTQESTPRSGLDFDAAPGQRLVGLAVVIVFPLVLIAARVAQLQLALQPAYVEPFFQTRQVVEDLPARQGRILAADGAVLADDVLTYDLLVHYRWLEDPIDRRWLRSKVWERLSRRERRLPAVVAGEEQAVCRRREQLWQDLSRLTRRSPSELQAAAREIQIRVERIWESVNHRVSASEPAEIDPPPANGDTPLWLTWLESWRTALLIPLDRSREDAVTVREQEDYHVLLTDVSANIADEIAAHPERYHGVKTAVRSRRVYPYRDLAPHVLGARTPLKDDEPIPDDMRSGESLGRSGIERQYQSVLQGRRGALQRLINRHGEVIASTMVCEPEHGRDVVLTLDLPLQQRAEQLLDAALAAAPPTGDDQTPETASAMAAPPVGGCLIAVDVRTGALLTAACAPRFDANLMVSATAAQWAAVTNDPRKPLYPRVTRMALPPGSVFKAVTAVAILEAGVMRPDETTPCIGYLDQPDQHRCLIFRHYGVGHGDIALADALARSCNVYFFRGARRMGPEPLVAWSQRFGIGMPTGLDLPSESTGTLPRPGESSRRWYAGDTLGLAIGQSTLTTTPLQIARMMAAIANGGALVTPHLVAAGGPTEVNDTLGTEARPVFAHPEPQPIADLHPATLLAIREGLDRVVQDPHGTGYKSVKLTEVTIAGKTGTAEAGGGRADHAWFAGYAPADHPRVAFAVVLEHGGSGSKAAGPIAREYVRALLDTGLITAERAIAGE